MIVGAARYGIEQLTRARVHRVEAELIEQTSDCGLRTLIITGNDQRTTIFRPRRLPIRGECGREDMVEGLYDPRSR